jgi:hypothetical protein
MRTAFAAPQLQNPIGTVNTWPTSSRPPALLVPLLSQAGVEHLIPDDLILGTLLAADGRIPDPFKGTRLDRLVQIAAARNKAPVGNIAERHVPEFDPPSLDKCR